MLNPVNFVVTESSNLFVCSDLHKSHNKDFIFKPRGFDRVQDHDSWIVRNWNDIVGPNDNVLFLGDFLVGAGADSYKVGKEFLFSLNGHITMLFGNHNAFIKQYYKESLESAGYKDNVEVYPLTCPSGKVTFVGNLIEGNVKYNGANHPYVASHFPMHSWLDMSKGRISLSGHEHGNGADWKPEEKTKGKKLDVGLDNAKIHLNSPVFSWGEIVKIMSKKQYVSVGHH